MTRRPRNGPSAVALALGLALAAGLASGATGCAGDPASDPPAESTTSFVIETENGTQAFAGDEDTGVFAFEGEAGSGTLSFDLDGDGIVAAGEGGAYELTPGVPDGWPADFPEVPGAELQGGSVVVADALRLLVAVYRTDRPGAEVTAFYEESLSDLDPIVDRRDDRPESYVASISIEGEWTGFVTINGTLEGTEVAVQLFTETN